jgi:hypothetical protein
MTWSPSWVESPKEMTMSKRKFKDGPLPGLDHYMLVIEGEKRSVTLAYRIMMITLDFVILEMNAGFVGFMMADLPGGDVLPMVSAREAYRLKDAIKQGQISVKQPANMSEEQAFEELMKDIDDAVDAVLAPESGGAPPYLQ